MKVKLIKRVWNLEPGTELDLDGAKLELVLRKKYAEPIKEKAVEKAPKNKAVGNAPKNKKK